jgi:hypothetical protein
MVPGGVGGKQVSLLRNWLLGSTENNGPLIGGIKPGPTTFLSRGTDVSGKFVFCLLEEELVQYMVSPMEGSSSSHLVCMEEIGTQFPVVLYEGSSTYHSSILLFLCGCDSPEDHPGFLRLFFLPVEAKVEV